MADDLFSKVLGGQAIEKASSVAHSARLSAHLSDQSRSAESPARLNLSRRCAFVAGVKGKLGEALLNQVLASEYASVIALAEKPISLGIRKLEVTNLGGLGAKPIDDAFLCLNDLEGPFARSYYGRDAHFQALSEEDARLLARRLQAHQVKRIVLLAPLSSWHQISKISSGIAGELESELLLLDLEALIVLRPSQEKAAPAGEGLIQKFARNYLAIFRMMLPQGTEVLRTEHLARAAVRANQYLPDGVHVLNNEALAARFMSPLSPGS